MDFTPLIPCGSLPSTTCDAFIATVFHPLRVIIRSTISLSIKRVINLDASFADGMTHLVWKKSKSNGHRRLLVADSRQVAAYDMDDENWALHISEGLGGVRQVDWSESGDEILVWADFQLKMTVWSLENQVGTIVPNPKFTQKGLSYRTSNQPSQAVFLQRTSHDVLCVLDIQTSNWSVIKSFPIATSDAQGVLWSPDGKWLAVHDNMIDYRVLLYTPDGRLMRTFVAYEIGLGIKCISWSPTSEYLAVGSFDNKLRLLNNSTFSPSIELSHVSTVHCEGTAVWRQVNHGSSSRYERADQPISPPCTKTTGGDALPKHGVGLVLFNPEGHLLVTRCDSMPTTLWIWSLRELSPVAVLINTNPIKTVKWLSEEAGGLVFTCQGSNINENNAIYLWNIGWSIPRIIAVPRDGFDVKWFQLVEDECEPIAGIMIGGADSFTIGYPVPEARTGESTILEEEDEEDELQGAYDKTNSPPQSCAIALQGSLVVHEQNVPTSLVISRPLAVL